MVSVQDAKPKYCGSSHKQPRAGQQEHTCLSLPRCMSGYLIDSYKLHLATPYANASKSELNCKVG